MALQSRLFGGDPKLEAAAVSDPAHILPGASGPHVGKVQLALIQLDGAAITQDSAYGPATAAAVRAFKLNRQILNFQGKIDDIVGKKTMVALDEGMLAKEKGGGGGQPTPAVDLAQLVSEFANLLRPAQRASFLGPANSLVSRSAIVGGGADANAGAIPLVVIALLIVMLFMIALTAQSQNPATKQMGREWAKRLARLREQIRGKPVPVQTAQTLKEARTWGNDVVENAKSQREKCLENLSPEKLANCSTALRKLSEAIQSLILAVKQGLGGRGTTEAGIVARIGRAAEAVFEASAAAAKCTGCDNMVL